MNFMIKCLCIYITLQLNHLYNMNRKGFLQLVAEDMHRTFGGNYSEVTMVFPNKRAQLFMNEKLAALHDDSPMWTPRYVTISDLFENLSDVITADPISLVCTLYKVYQEVTGSQETLDHFYSWGELMISDFDDIDNNLTDAEKLFANITDLQDMTSFDYLSENQKEALKHFFSNFNPDRRSTLQGKFKNVWNALYPIYKRFHEELLHEKKAYGGMMKRLVAEAIKGKDRDQLVRKLQTKHYLIVGFNVLNATEKALFKFLKEECNTVFYWDYDKAYAETEAGQFIKENMQLFPNRFTDADYFNNIASDTEKHISIISSPTEDAQSRYVTQWLKQNEVTLDNRTAIVLCNEKLLNSVLHSIPTSADGKNVALNVTMGFPLSEMPIYGYVTTLLELQAHGRTTTGNWRYSVACKVLRHPYTKRLTDGASIELLTTMKARNMMFPADSMFDGNPVLRTIFSKCSSPKEMTPYLIDIIEKVGAFDEESPLFKESIYNAFTLVNRIGNILEERTEFVINMDTYGRLLRQLMKNHSIPFHGEPAIGLQVMGFLETRNLDFDNIIMLSTNEGQMPRITQNNSFIPYTLRIAYGMTTLEKKTSIYAYYYYRLLQRARNITLMYCDGESAMAKGEMSRFMLQTLVEQKRLFAPNVTIEQKTLFAESSIERSTELNIGTSPEILDRLRQLYDLTYEEEYKAAHRNSQMLLTPSAINCYIDCKRKFYLKYIAGLGKEEDIMEEVDNAMFGTLFHYCMETLYRPLLHRQVQSSYLYHLAEDRETIEHVVDESFAVNFFHLPKGQPAYNLKYNGDNLLNRHVLIRYVTKQLKNDAQRCPFTLLGIESKHYRILEVPCDWGSIKVRIGGIIDRYEMVDGSHDPQGKNIERIRIVDYKTSNRAQQTRSVHELFDASCKTRAYHILQALYYCSVMAEKEQHPIFPELLYIKAKESVPVSIGKNAIIDFVTEVSKDYDEELSSTIASIFSSNAEYPTTNNSHNCEYCDFKQLCNKD